MANPDLRMGGYTLGYQASWGSLAGTASSDAALRRIQALVVVIAPVAADYARTCRRVAHCRVEVAPGPLPYHLAANAVRDPWIAAVIAAIRPPDHAP